MPIATTHEKKEKHLAGEGPPTSALKARLGQKYLDQTTRQFYWLTKSGWVEASFLHLHPLYDQKNTWVRAAKAKGLNLEEFVFQTLDAAAAKILSVA